MYCSTACNMKLFDGLLLPIVTVEYRVIKDGMKHGGFQGSLSILCGAPSWLIRREVGNTKM